MSRRPLPIVLLALVMAGCTATPPIAPKKTTAPAAAKSAKPGNPALKPIPAASEATRPVTSGIAVALTGQVGLISDHGAGIISNNSGALISDHGAGLVGNNGGALISDHGAGLVGKTKRQLLEAPAEAPLAEAQIEVLDGEGKLLVGADGQPITALTDAEGRYALSARLPDEALVLRVRLFPNGGPKAAAGGQLLALVPKGATGALDVGTASSFGAAYVLEKYVQQRAGVLDRLPAAESTALTRDLAGAVAQLPPGPPTYKPADQAAATEALRGKAPTLDATLERIRAILVAGATFRGGRPALDVALAGPLGLAGKPGGDLYVSELTGGRIRVLRPDGTLALFAGGVSATAGQDGDDALAIGLESPHGMAIGPDGHLYVADRFRNHVRRFEVGADGIARVQVVAGDGQALQGPVGVPATATSIRGPAGLAFDQAGRLYISEAPKSAGKSGRLLVREVDGTLNEVAVPPPEGAQIAVNWVGLAVAPDGRLIAVDRDGERLMARSPDGSWKVLAKTTDAFTDFASIACAADGSIYYSTDGLQQIRRIDPAGADAVFAGTGAQGYAGDGGPAAQATLNQPGGLWLDGDQRLVFTDYGNGVVRAIALGDPTRTVSTIAGTQALGQQGNALAISISNPTGIALDPTGALVVAETTGHTIRRLLDGRLTVIAGLGAGFAGDGGPATQARLTAPAGIAYQGDALIVVDGANKRIRKIAKDGTITTIIGNGGAYTRTPAARHAPTEPFIDRAFGVAVAPDGRLYWSDNGLNQVWRQNADGTCELVAGAVDYATGDDGDGGPAQGAHLTAPTYLAFSPAGDLYIADTANLKIRKVSGLDGPSPTIATVAGLGAAQTLIGYQGVTSGDTPLEEPVASAPILGPVGLVFTADGDLLFGEAGASKLTSALGFSGLSGLSFPPIGSRIRRISGLGTPAARVKTVAGHGAALLNDPRTDDSLNTPLGLLIDREGRLVVADAGNNQIKLLPRGAF